MNSKLYVVKRDGRKEDVSFDKITNRIKLMSKDLGNVDAGIVAQKVIDRIFPGITTSVLDDEAGSIAANMETVHLDYGKLATNILISNLQKNTKSFSETIKELYSEGNMADYMYYITSKYGDIIDKYIDYDRDYKFTYFGFRTLEKLYLLRDKNRKVLERPQHMWMRVAISIFRQDVIDNPNIDWKNIMNENYLKQFANVEEKETFHITNKMKDGSEHRERRIETKIDNINFSKLDEELEKIF